MLMINARLMALMVAMIWFSGCTKVMEATSDQVETEMDTPVTVFITGTSNFKISNWTTYDVMPPEHGTLEGDDYKRIYTPEPGFTGTDKITFRLGFDGEFTDYADILIHVGPTAGKLDRIALNDFVLRKCVRAEGRKEKVEYANQVNDINCEGKVEKVGGNKLIWLEDTPICFKSPTCQNPEFISFESLEGIQQFTQLKGIKIDPIYSTSIVPLLDFKDQLKVMHLGVDGADIPLLAEFDQLTDLVAISYYFDGFEEFSNLSQLEHLSLDGLRFPSDFASIVAVDWQNLKSLSLMGQMPSLAGIESSNMPQLADLSLTFSGESDLSALLSADFPNLTRLHFDFRDQGSLDTLVHLDFADIKHLSIKLRSEASLAVLAGFDLTGLVSLTLEEYKLTDNLAGTENLSLPDLKILDIRFLTTNLTDYSALLTWQMPKVELIRLGDGPVNGKLACADYNAVVAQFPTAKVTRWEACEN